MLSRKSWVTAIPMEANASDVRSQARNVRSTYQHVSMSFTKMRGRNRCWVYCTNGKVISGNAPRVLELDGLELF